jgi:hypothetical protein
LASGVQLVLGGGALLGDLHFHASLQNSGQAVVYEVGDLLTALSN